MNIELVPSHVKKLISEQMAIELDKVQPQSRFIEDLGADSLDTVEMVMALEDEFSVEIVDADAEKILTVQDAIDAVLRLQASETSTTVGATE